MKQFSLKEYLENPEKKVITRDGRNVRIRCTDRKGEGQPIVALVESMNGDMEIVSTFRKDGKWNPAGRDSDVDLFFAPEKHEGWINIYRGPLTGVPVYKTEEDAKHCANTEVIATIKIEWEE